MKMALPTLQPFWMKRYKNAPEHFHVQRAQHEFDFRNTWDKNRKYFIHSNVEATKKRAWQSDQCFRQSMDALDALYQKDRKTSLTAERRKKLSELLLKEQKEYEIELQQLRFSQRGQEMKTRAETLKTAREERRKKTAKDKLYEHWKINAPELREIESEKFKKHVVDSWKDQNDDKIMRDNFDKEQQERMESEMEKQRLLLIHRDKELQHAKKMKEKETAKQLQMQINELRIREEEAAMLKQEEERLEIEQRIIDKAEDQRKAIDDERKKKSHGFVLIQQHKAQMKRKSLEVQKALEIDLEILRNMAEKESKDEEIKTSRREKARADARYMQQVIEDQLRVEKAREAELDSMYRDEAARMWQKRDAEWERERLARERLMTEVLDERKKQIEEKLNRIRKQHEESLESQEALLNEMEAVNRMTQREKKHAEERKRFRERELQTQIKERQQIQMQQNLKDKERFETQRQQEDSYQQMLRHEAERITERGMGQKSYRRRKIAFD
ncbi:trichoplein keratin filament-binding protein-like [Xenia sp. Carnegie-2017]|uniref:trichoplein keratin filament-binding protein-like n=1 Tax=Xenia sp. Carnegie-2017 TaxID=2897299 RepID=UPI001F03EFA9|nr:trichoplein keratin filament-binding protein-like [Xenia sp. Carnegie-2017]